MGHQTTCPFFADGATRRLLMYSDAARQHDYASIRRFTDRLRGDELMITKRQMDPAPFEGRHRLQLEHLVGLHDALGGAVGKISKLVLTTASVVLDINEDPRPFADALREQQIDEMLQGGEAFAFASDQGAQSLLLVSLPNNVQAVRLAGLDLNADIEPELGHELLEDLFCRRHSLWRDLSRFGPLGVRSDPSSSNLGEILGRQAGLRATLWTVITRPPIGTSATAAIAVEMAATWARTAIATWARAAVARGATVVATWARAAVARGATVVATWARTAVAVMAVVPVVTRALVAIWCWGRQWDLRRRLTLGGNATQQRLGRGENACRLGAHAKDTSGTRGQDLEVEIVMANSELLTGVAKGLFDRLAGELAVSVAIGSHFSVVSLVDLCVDGC